jgi:hypothetical protein
LLLQHCLACQLQQTLQPAAALAVQSVADPVADHDQRTDADFKRDLSRGDPKSSDYTTQITIAQEPTWYNSESWLEWFDYREAGPQLLMQAFLQWIVNGGGVVEREYGLGRGRTDLRVMHLVVFESAIPLWKQLRFGLNPSARCKPYPF